MHYALSWRPKRPSFNTRTGSRIRRSYRRTAARSTIYLARPGAHEVQLDLFGDYTSNVALYPAFQAYFRKHKPPLLAVWGRNDPFFLPAGAEAFTRDNPQAVVRFFATGHFALETHCQEIAVAIRDFLAPDSPGSRSSSIQRS